jgi:hypothetical protein
MTNIWENLPEREEEYICPDDLSMWLDVHLENPVFFAPANKDYVFMTSVFSKNDDQSMGLHAYLSPMAAMVRGAQLSDGLPFDVVAISFDTEMVFGFEWHVDKNHYNTEPTFAINGTDVTSEHNAVSDVLKYDNREFFITVDAMEDHGKVVYKAFVDVNAEEVLENLMQVHGADEDKICNDHSKVLDFFDY